MTMNVKLHNKDMIVIKEDGQIFLIDDKLLLLRTNHMSDDEIMMSQEYVNEIKDHVSDIMMMHYHEIIMITLTKLHSLHSALSSKTNCSSKGIW